MTSRRYSSWVGETTEETRTSGSTRSPSSHRLAGDGERLFGP